MPRLAPRALGLAVGYASDRLLGDPTRWHPVAGFGLVAGALETALYADSRTRGVLFSGVLLAASLTAGAGLDRAARARPLVATLTTAAATWAVLGGTSLDREAGHVHSALTAGDLPTARLRLTHLVGRDTAGLDEGEVARATIESVAENTSDAVVAPLLLGSVAGVAGLLGYRAANTLDAMVGHRDARYARFGWASARLDDWLNLGASRAAALLAAVLARSVGGSPAAAVHVWRRDGRHHPSPNAGPVEASFAGALGITLGGVNVYRGRIQHRPALGSGPPPTVDDIHRARALAGRVSVAAAAFAVLVATAGRPAA